MRIACLNAAISRNNPLSINQEVTLPPSSHLALDIEAIAQEENERLADFKVLFDEPLQELPVEIIQNITQNIPVTCRAWLHLVLHYGIPPENLKQAAAVIDTYYLEKSNTFNEYKKSLKDVFSTNKNSYTYTDIQEALKAKRGLLNECSAAVKNCDLLRLHRWNCAQAFTMRISNQIPSHIPIFVNSEVINDNHYFSGSRTVHVPWVTMNMQLNPIFCDYIIDVSTITQKELNERYRYFKKLHLFLTNFAKKSKRQYKTACCINWPATVLPTIIVPTCLAVTELQDNPFLNIAAYYATLGATAWLTFLLARMWVQKDFFYQNAMSIHYEVKQLQQQIEWISNKLKEEKIAWPAWHAPQPANNPIALEVEEQ